MSIFSYGRILCLLCGFALLPFLSCAARINGSLSADGSAALTVGVSLEPRMTSLIRRLSAAGGAADGPALDGPAIAQSMSVSGIASVSLRNITPAAVEGTVQVLNINEFLTAAGGRRFIEFEQGRAGGSCRISINRDNGPEIIEKLSTDIADYLNALMAPLATGEELNKREYLELITSVYNKPISDEISLSRIRASIEFPGQITSVRGGTSSGRRADFDIYLIDLLVLEEPLIYEVRWR
jgi:hypothetical protein